MILVRKGTPKDIKALFRLIKELAVYEKADNEVEVTEKQLLEDGFGPNKIYDFYVATKLGKVIGIALYYTKYSTWKGKCIYLEDIIVSEKYRKLGVGTLLFNKVVAEAKKINAKRLEWQVLNWNTPAIDFYKKYEAEISDEWLNGRLNYAQIKSFKSFK